MEEDRQSWRNYFMGKVLWYGVLPFIILMAICLYDERMPLRCRMSLAFSDWQRNRRLKAM